MSDQLVITSKEMADKLPDVIKSMLETDGFVVVTLSTNDVRTVQQNKALHKYFSLLSDTFNDGGLDMRLVLEKLSDKDEIPWTPEAVKERLWRPVQIHQIDKKSTKNLKRKQVSEIFETLTRALRKYFPGIPVVHFPDRFGAWEDEQNS